MKKTVVTIAAVVVGLSTQVSAGEPKVDEKAVKTVAATEGQAGHKLAGIDKKVSALISSLDTDKDAQLSKEEVAANPDLLAKFEKLDANGDGVLTIAEMKKVAKHSG